MNPFEIAADVTARLNQALPHEHHLGNQVIPWLGLLIQDQWGGNPSPVSMPGFMHRGLYINRDDFTGPCFTQDVWSVRRDGCPFIAVHVNGPVVCAYVSSTTVAVYRKHEHQ